MCCVRVDVCPTRLWNRTPTIMQCANIWHRLTIFIGNFLISCVFLKIYPRATPSHIILPNLQIHWIKLWIFRLFTSGINGFLELVEFLRYGIHEYRFAHCDLMTLCTKARDRPPFHDPKIHKSNPQMPRPKILKYHKLHIVKFQHSIKSIFF